MIELFDPRVHPAALSDQDLETLLEFGLRGAVAVCDASVHPPSPEAHFTHFDELLGTQLPRLERAGLKAWAALGVHPATLPRRGLGQILEALPGYLAGGRVVALGLLGLWKGSEAELDALHEHLRLAEEYRLPVLVTAPGRDKERLTRQLLAALQEGPLPPGQVLIDGAVGKTVRAIRELGFVAGLTLHPEHLEVEKAVELVRALGPERLVLASAAGDGASDILALPRAANRLERGGLSAGVVARVCGKTAAALLGVRVF